MEQMLFFFFIKVLYKLLSSWKVTCKLGSYFESTKTFDQKHLAIFCVFALMHTKKFDVLVTKDFEFFMEKH